METRELTAALKAEARRLGFALVGACPAAAPAGMDRFREWLAAGYAGQMHYLPDRAGAYEHPDGVLAGTRSLLMLAMNYRTSEPAAPREGEGRVSRYGWGRDYHDLMHDRLHALAGFLRALVPQARVRGVVDSAPLLEREFAQRAGLGWIGKHTLLLNRQGGSWFFLAALLTDLELTYDEGHESDHCGTCRACLDACPTNAFPQPYVLDATRCISYLTIELRDSIPRDLREGMQDWVFGCDVCQDVCPWNRRAPHSDEPALAPEPGMNPIDAAELLSLDETGFRRRFRGTPLWRAGRRGLLRNAAIVLGNRPGERGRAALLKGLNDDEPMIRSASAWALGRHGDRRAREALAARLAKEEDDEVRREIGDALERTGGAPAGCDEAS
jgi:epoxyqueuosine reductase